MKVLIANYDKFAHYYIHMGLAHAMTAAGMDVVMWDIDKKPIFDAFDEFEPDLFIGQTFNVNESIIKVIEERPSMMVIMKASDDGPIHDAMDHRKYPVLVASQREKDMMQKLIDRTGKPDFLFVHYMEDRLDQTHKYWRDRDFRVESLLSGADVISFTNGVSKPELACDIAFVGGRWGYKSQTLDKWFLPLLEQNLKIKIFGNQPWGVPQYCGFIPDNEVKNLFSSAKICPNLSEPHSQVFGYDIVERPFKLLSNKCFVISDKVEDLVKLIPNGIAYASTPVEFMEKIYYYLNKEEKRKEIANRGYKAVLDGHTYFHRAAHIFDKLGRPDMSLKIMESYVDIKEKLHL